MKTRQNLIDQKSFVRKNRSALLCFFTCRERHKNLTVMSVFPGRVRNILFTHCYREKVKKNTRVPSLLSTFFTRLFYYWQCMFHFHSVLREGRTYWFKALNYIEIIRKAQPSAKEIEEDCQKRRNLQPTNEKSPSQFVGKNA